MNIFAILDLSIVAIASLFLVDVLAYGHDIIGLSEPPIAISPDWKPFFEFLIYPLILLLIVDLYFKYRKTKDPKKFIKKYWIDITMLILIPILSIFKFFKVGLSLIKKLKTAKMGTKVIHKSKKISKK
ncbi:MAG: hypothetical protein HKM23_03605 [Nitrosopumilus sp.]|nr:hypothetical protein [Nitrosopumilus sp.]NNL59674.1 hypothetical protein [Nitrosopumilus sp.]